MAWIDHRDAAEAGLRVLTDPALWGAHHDLTGPVPMSWPEALELLSAELGKPVTFRVAEERQFRECLIGAGVPAGTAELLITREWAILAGENDYTTDTFQKITGRPPYPSPSSCTSTARNTSDAPLVELSGVPMDELLNNLIVLPADKLDVVWRPGDPPREDMEA
jgi:hypothetical protein